MRDLDGRTALVTGAGKGIGRAIAVELARLGARLVLCDVDEPALEDARAAVDGTSHCLIARRADVASEQEMRDFAAQVHELVPAVDVLVNNAGVGLGGGLLDTSLEDWRWVLGVNLWGVIHGCHFFVPPMVARGAGGHVVNVSSALGFYGQAGVIGYVTSKFGVLGLGESLRGELAPHGIGVSTICPGIIDTAIISTARFRGTDNPDGVRTQVGELFKRRRYGPERVARAVVRAVRRNEPIVPVAPEAWALYFMKRIAPSLGSSVSRFIERHVGL